MSTFTKYSTDSGAPSISGIAGGGLEALRWFLVTISGWAEVWTGTNQATFRAPDTTGRRFYLFVDDSATSFIYFRGYESWSGSSGTNPFPTVAQVANGTYIQRSYTTDSTTRAWRASGNGKCFTFQALGYNGANQWSPMFFGDFISWLPGDGYNVALMGHTNTNTVGSSSLFLRSSSSGATYIARGRDQTTKSVTASVNDFVPYPYIQNTTICGGQITYPDPMTGGVLATDIALCSESAIRGVLPGLKSHAHTSQSFPDPVTNITGLSGSFKPWPVRNASGDSTLLVNTAAWENDV